MASENEDDYILEPMSLPPEQFPALTRGQQILGELERKLEERELIWDVLNAPPEIVQLFGKVFPEIQAANNVGMNTTEDYAIYQNNSVVIEADPEEHRGATGEGMDVYVGGPSTLVAAAIQAKDGEEGDNVLYVTDGLRGISNWKGSALAYIVRDLLPLYYFSSNSGLTVLWTTVRHLAKRRVTPAKYMKEVKTDSSFSVFRLNFRNFLLDPRMWWLVGKNQWNMLRDCGIHLRGTALVPNDKTIAHVSVNHTIQCHEILRHLDFGFPIYKLGNRKTGLSCDVIMTEKKPPRFTDSVGRIKEIIGADKVISEPLPREELEDRGYDMSVIKRVVSYPRDGELSQTMAEDLEGVIERGGGKIRHDLRLKKILVRGTGEDCAVSRVVWENTQSGEEETTPIKTLYTSLGPSMKSLTIGDSVHKGIFRRVAEKIGLGNLQEPIMFATAGTFTVLVTIDKEKVREEHLRMFRDHKAAGVKHMVRLGEREVRVGEKSYQVIAVQCTAGGHFPIQHAHPEAPLNHIRTVLGPVLGLERDGVSYDIMSVRSCSRGVTALNVFRVTAPASNLVMMYGQGGIGMGMSVSNGLLMKCIMGIRQRLGRGEISHNEYLGCLKESKFGEVPHWKHPVPFARDYTRFYDKGTTQVVARNLFLIKPSIIRFLRFIK